MLNFYKNIGLLVLIICLGSELSAGAVSYEAVGSGSLHNAATSIRFAPATASAHSTKKSVSLTRTVAASASPAQVAPTTELLQFTPSSLAIEIPSGRVREMKVYLNNSDEDPVLVRLTAFAPDGSVPAWLLVNDLPLTPPDGVPYQMGAAGSELFFTVEASTLTQGTYLATVKAEAPGYQPADLALTLTVSSFDEGLRPYVTEVRPANGTTNVRPDQSVSVDLAFPSGQSIDGSTVHSETVKLFRLEGDSSVEVVGTVVNTTAAGDAITLSARLELGKTYEFLITELVKDDNGYAMLPFTSRFTTAATPEDIPTDLTGVSFKEQVLIGNNFGSDGFTSLAVGPDRRLYATTSGGKIERWDIAPNGTLRNHTSFSPFGSDRRLLVGFAFDPASTPDRIIAWISHSSPDFNNVEDWTGKVSRLELNDPNNLHVQDFLIHLPRSIKDHATNGVNFGPDGALYILQGGNSAMGDPDAAWGHRPERLLTAAMLRLDMAMASQMPLPIDVKTEEGGTYNPYASGAPLTIYATGIRNAYDLVWHSSGQLYVPTNGSAAGGNTPALQTGQIWSSGEAYTGPPVPALQNVRATQNDFLFRVEQGGYYGHPNPTRNEYIMNGGNPTEGEDPGEVTWVTKGKTLGYPVGTPPEPNYRGWSYNFGLNKSPNGIIEYKSNAFGGKLQGKLLICRFSGGDDIMVLEPGSGALDIIMATEGSQIQGFRRPFANPLDVTEDPLTGNLYISEYFDGNGDGRPRITLLRAGEPASPTAFTLSLETVGVGKVNKNPGEANFLAGTQVTLSAEPATGFEFVGWSGDAVGLQNPLRVTMDTNKTVTARFRRGPQSDGITRINAGGEEQTVGGIVWTGCPDPTTCQGYVAGGTSYSKSPTPSIIGAPLGTDTDLFQTAWTDEQHGSVNSVAFTYDIPVINGPYLIRLYFAELDKTEAGQRIFDVHLEGDTTHLVGLDVYREAQGAHRVLVKEIPYIITDGTVTLDFIRRVDHPFVNAIEIVPNQTTVGFPGIVATPTQGLWVYPNPTPRDQVRVHLQGFGREQNVQVTVQDLAGRVVRSLAVVTDQTGEYRGQLNINQSLAKGVYLLRAVSESGSKSIKFIAE